MDRCRKPSIEAGWPSRDPIGEDGGLNLYGFVFNDPIYYYDPFGLSVCSDFVDSLVKDFQAHNDSEGLGKDWLDKRATTLKEFDGFKDELVAGGQGGAVSRHVYGHGGALLWGESPAGLSPAGYAASYLQQSIDYIQRFQKGRTKTESRAEIADDKAGRAVGNTLRDAYHNGKATCNLDKLRKQLMDLLCK